MLLVDNAVVIGNSSNIKYYTERGYVITYNNPTTVNVNDLTPSSKAIVKVKCDKCETIKDMMWSSYYKNTKKLTCEYFCINCCTIKTKSTNLKKYGTESPIQNETIKNKIKTTNLKKWGSTCTLHSNKLKPIISQIFEEKFGGYPLGNDEIKEKIKQTILSKYGVDAPLQNDEIKEKMKATNISRYGFENPFQNENIKEKIKSTNLNKYGVEFSFQSEIVKNKIKISIENKYGTNKKYVVNTSNEKFLSLGFSIIDYFKNSNYELMDLNVCKHTFIINNDIFNGRIEHHNTVCTICNPIRSFSSTNEDELKKWFDVIGIKYDNNNRNVIKPKEIDIYLPKYNLAIEYNGLYWHSEHHRDKTYHLNKTVECQKQNIQLLHIFEDDWLYKKEIVKSIILNKINMISDKIYARKCEIKEVKPSDARIFLEQNHIQGSCKSKYKIGLYHNNELVSLMSFGYRKTNAKKEFELIRFCNKINTNVIGASSKLFKFFIKNYKIEESYLISYSDLSLFDGKMYETLGFEYKHLSKPNYFWVVGDKREHRFKYNKQKLINEGFDSNKTEVEIMHERGYYRIWGCGQVRWVYNI